MKAYILTEDDFKKLTAAIDRDPKWGYNGGSSKVLTEEETRAYEEAHSFFNYQVHTWLDKVMA